MPYIQVYIHPFVARYAEHCLQSSSGHFTIQTHMYSVHIYPLHIKHALIR